MSNQKFAVFDIDGTVFRSSLVVELMYSLVKTGVFPNEAREEFRASHDAWQKREHADAYDDYIRSLVASYIKQLAGKSQAIVKSEAEQVVAKYQNHTYTYSRDLIKTLKKQGYFLLAISGSPSELVKAFCQAYEFDDFVATQYLTDEQGNYNGQMVESHHKKDEILETLVTKHQLNYEGSLAIGDSRGDITLLQAVQQPIAFNPDRDLAKAAQEHGWKMVVERKNVVYELDSAKGSFQVIS